MKIKVHNLNEAKALIAEWNESMQHVETEITFESHNGEFIAKTAWDNAEYKHVML